MGWLLRYCRIFVFCCLAGNGFAQSTVIGTNTENESSRTICADLLGNMYVGGTISDDIFITKLNDQSNVIWNKRIAVPSTVPNGSINSLQLLGDTLFGCGYYGNYGTKQGSFFFKMNASTGSFYWMKSLAETGNVLVDIRYANGKYFLTGEERIANHFYGKVTAVSSQTGNIIWETQAFRYHVDSQLNSLWTTLENSTEMVNGKMFILGSIQTNQPNSATTIRPLVLGINENGTVFLNKYLNYDASGINYKRIQGVSIKYDGTDSLVLTLAHVDNYNSTIFDFAVIMKCDLQLNGGFTKSYSIGDPLPSYTNVNTLTVTNNNYVIYGGGGANAYDGMFVLKLDKQGNFVKSLSIMKGSTGYDFPFVSFVNAQDEGFGNSDFKNGKHYFPASEFHIVPYNYDVNTIVIDENLDFSQDCSELLPLVTITYSLTKTVEDCFVEQVPDANVYTDLVSTTDLVFDDACANKTHSFHEVVGCSGTTVTSAPSGFSAPSFQWSNGSTDSMVTVTTTDTLIVRVTDTKCCYIIDTIVPQISQNTLSLQLPADTTICSNGNISYTIVPNVVASPNNASYNWSTGTTNPQLTVTSGGIYWLDVTNSCGTVRDSIVVTALLLPVISGTTSIQACPSDFPIQYAPGQVNDATSVYWENNTTTTSRLIDSAGTYTLTAVNSCGQTSFTVMVTEQPLPEIDWIGSLDTCMNAGQTVTLSPTYTNTTSVLWSTGEATQTIQVSQTGSYTVIASNSCGSADSTAQVTINHLPVLNLPPTLDTCFDIGIGFSYTAPGSPGNYSWNSGSQTATETITQNGIYTVTLNNQCGSVTKSMLVNRVSDISLSVGVDSVLVCEGSILPEVLLIETNYEYEILNSDLVVQQGRISRTGWYYVRAFNKCGDAMDSVYVDFQEEQVFYIPNSFTPNSDDINEYYTWAGNNVTVSEFQVFNRWGEIVFDGSDPNGWNGFYKGAPCPVGVYTVRVVVQNCAGMPEEHAGFVALVR